MRCLALAAAVLASQPVVVAAWIHGLRDVFLADVRPQGNQAALAPDRGDDAPAPPRKKPTFPSRPGEPPAGFIALGDSYSAGIGTGVNDTEDECRHGLHAYPMLVHADLVDQHGANSTSFQHLSCTGSTVDDVLAGGKYSQIDSFNTTSTADFALLSIGGNDLGFFDIMNSCIFRFYSFYSGTCEAALRNSEEQIAGPEFEHRLRLAIMEILDRVQWEQRLWFTIAVTGYARFFNDETDECDDCSFGVWWRGPRLERELRQRMNAMVLSVNGKIRQSIDSINSGFTDPRVFFVDYDDAFEGHRFCEPSVIEPDYGRNDTWFFLVGGLDNGLDAAANATAAGLASNVPLDRGSPLIDPDVCMGPAQESGDWGELALCMMAIVAKQDPLLRHNEGQLVAESSMWYVPTYYGKTFHPRTLGHRAIRDRVYELWEDMYVKRPEL